MTGRTINVDHELARLRDREQLLVEALSYYADIGTWERMSAEDAIPAGVMPSDPRAMLDRGQRARHVLRDLGAGS